MSGSYLRRTILVGVATMTAVAVTACGGDDGDGNGDGDGLSRQEFVQTADATCKRLAPPNPPSAQTREQAEEQAREQVEKRTRRLRALRDLEPPAELRQDYDEFLGRSTELIAAVQDAQRAAERDRQEDHQKAMQRFDELGSSRKQVADRIGFKVCGQPVPPPEGDR